MPYRLLAVHAHPDDESSKGAATMAKYVAEGNEVMVVSCTGGEAGDILNDQLGEPATSRAHRDMAGYRRSEMAAAQAALGIQHVWLGYHDSGLPDAEQGETVRPGTFATVPLEFSTEVLVRVSAGSGRTCSSPTTRTAATRTPTTSGRTRSPSPPGVTPPTRRSTRPPASPGRSRSSTTSAR